MAVLCSGEHIDQQELLVPEIATYHNALAAIWDRSGYDKGFISNPFAGDDAARLGLVRTRNLLNRAGYTALPYRIVHVAGSKGKGSTSTMIDSMLRAAGHRTGRFLSPHLHSFRERFVINDHMISEDDFISLTREFVMHASEIEEQSPEIGAITAFELNTAMALAWFARQECEVAVIEVGMGGMLDSTNIVLPDVSVITTLDFEHTAILGETMAEIATNKAGIIKQGKPVLTASQPPETLAVFTDVAAKQDAPLLVADRDWRVEGSWSNFRFTQRAFQLSDLGCSLVGEHQMHNAGLAIAAVRTLDQQAPELTIEDTAIRTGIASARIPARFEVVQPDAGPTFVIDGAHTPASTAALAAAVSARFPNRQITMITGMLGDKNVAESLAPLGDISSMWIAVAPHNPRAVPASQLQAAINALGFQAETATNVAEGIDLARIAGADVVVITGSFTLAAEARVALNLAEVIDPPMVGVGTPG